MSFLSAEQKQEFRAIAHKFLHRRAGKMIAEADENKDGVLTWDEVSKMMIGADEARIAEEKAEFEATDLNKDGKIDQEELATYMTKVMMLTLKEKTPVIDIMAKEIWTTVNEKCEGKLDFEHLWSLEIIPAGLKTEENREKAKILFEKVDVDHTGTLTKDEVVNALFRFVMK